MGPLSSSALSRSSGIVSGAGAHGDLERRLRHVQNALGAVPSPFDCYLVLRGIKTLAMRMERCARTAMAVARRLDAHDAVLSVVYPGLPSHPPVAGTPPCG